ncbi:MAG: phosphatase PAP2 family protein [Lachnospiraceae bacterium]|jgi:membrane-associated phospholipid phosphatase|nr:phosphatase PAP2 family protein [Lachnospiraceae bacterium]
MLHSSGKKNITAVKASEAHGLRGRGTPREKLAYVIDYTRDARPLFLYTVVYFVWFYLLEHVNRLHYTVIHTALDDRIPFIEVFVLPYFCWFAFVVAGMVLLYLYDRETYHRCAAMMVMGSLFFLVLSTIWPNILYLRPTVMPRDNIFTRMIQALYATDTPTNVCPSIHVYYSIIIAAGALHTNARMKHPAAIRSFAVVLAAAIILSTIFIKQHSVFDVMCGCLMAVPTAIACFRFGFTFTKNYGKAAISAESGIQFDKAD